MKMAIIPLHLVSENKLGPKIKRDISTDSIISKFPLMPDLWESQMVEVKSSGLGEGAGQGLFTLVNVQKGQILGKLYTFCV